MHEEILERVAPFQPTPGLRVEDVPDLGRVLEVPLTTDIADLEVTGAFRDAVESVWNDSEAARGARLRIRVSWNEVRPETLYPEGVPPAGAELDEEDHLSRFEAGRLILTTGARSTHALTGRAILLGTEPRTPRSLAHEFGHLVGFNDAYLRAAEGSPEDPFGSVLVEWTGLSNDLMGSPNHGRVTEAMIDQLLRAYGD
jgi:hypothetical protein